MNRPSTQIKYLLTFAVLEKSLRNVEMTIVCGLAEALLRRLEK